MGKTSRKKYTPEFKAQVAIEVLKEQSTLAELAKKYHLQYRHYSAPWALFLKTKVSKKCI